LTESGGPFIVRPAGRRRLHDTEKMPLQVQPYLFFNGRCEEAVNFYKTAIGAEVLMMSRFGEAPDPGMSSPDTANKIMHATLQVGDTILMASDGDCKGGASFQGFSLSLSAADQSEAEQLFNALADGGQVQMPLTKTFWSPGFGMLTDRFGVGWMVNIVHK
jgi:PhnB protein